MAKNLNSISVIIIAKNEAKRIKSCIESILWADEIILVDNKSTDNTIEFAEKFPLTIINAETDNFSQLRIIGLKNSHSKWILYIDADEIVTSMLQTEIIQILQTPLNLADNAYKIKRQNFYYGHNLWPHIDILERLFQKQFLHGWFGKVHESPQIEGKVGLLNGYLSHFSHRTITEMIDKTNSWSNIEAELRFNHQHPNIVGWRLIRVMISGFCDSFINQQGYRAGTVGWIESIYQAFSLFITYAKLWELQNQSKVN
jgi:glycosyltransferase involved in cell wall biosynthesis